MSKGVLKRRKMPFLHRSVAEIVREAVDVSRGVIGQSLARIQATEVCSIKRIKDSNKYPQNDIRNSDSKFNGARMLLDFSLR